MYKGSAGYQLGSNKLDYLVSFRTTEKTYLAINQIMDDETDRYHYALEPLDQKLYQLSKQIWSHCEQANNPDNENGGTETKAISAIKNERMTITLPKPPSDVGYSTGRALVADTYDRQNGTQIGIVKRIFKDNDDARWITVYYKDRLNELPYKGYVLLNICTDDNFACDNLPGELSKSDKDYFLKMLVPGRRIEFQTEVVGTGVLSHASLLYIKPLPNATMPAKGAVIVDHYIR
jgi:hypothetical protein